MINTSLAPRTERAKVVRMIAAKPGTVVNDRASYSVHHLSKREGSFLRGFFFRASPARHFGEELGSHVSATIIGRAKLVRNKTLLASPRSGFKPDDAQASFGQQRSHDAAHGSYANPHNISWSS